MARAGQGAAHMSGGSRSSGWPPRWRWARMPLSASPTTTRRAPPRRPRAFDDGARRPSVHDPERRLDRGTRRHRPARQHDERRRRYRATLRVVQQGHRAGAVAGRGNDRPERRRASGRPRGDPRRAGAALGRRAEFRGRRVAHGDLPGRGARLARASGVSQDPHEAACRRAPSRTWSSRRASPSRCSG